MNSPAGKRNSLVELRRRPDAETGWGEPNRDPTAMILVAKLWVSIRNMSGIATIKAGSETSVVKASLRGNYRTDVKADMELWHGTTRYRIEAVLPDEAGHEYTDYVCKVVT